MITLVFSPKQHLPKEMQHSVPFVSHMYAMNADCGAETYLDSKIYIPKIRKITDYYHLMDVENRTQLLSLTYITGCKTYLRNKLLFYLHGCTTLG